MRPRGAASFSPRCSGEAWGQAAPRPRGGAGTGSMGCSPPPGPRRNRTRPRSGPRGPPGTRPIRVLSESSQKRDKTGAPPSLPTARLSRGGPGRNLADLEVRVLHGQRGDSRATRSRHRRRHRSRRVRREERRARFPPRRPVEPERAGSPGPTNRAADVPQQLTPARRLRCAGPGPICRKHSRGLHVAPYPETGPIDGLRHDVRGAPGDPCRPSPGALEPRHVDRLHGGSQHENPIVDTAMLMASAAMAARLFRSTRCARGTPRSPRFRPYCIESSLSHLEPLPEFGAGLRFMDRTLKPHALQRASNTFQTTSRRPLETPAGVAERTKRKGSRGALYTPYVDGIRRDRPVRGPSCSTPFARSYAGGRFADRHPRAAPVGALVYLIHHRDRVVSTGRAAGARVGRGSAVTESSASTAIGEVRRAIEDGRRQPRLGPGPSRGEGLPVRGRPWGRLKRD